MKWVASILCCCCVLYPEFVNAKHSRKSIEYSDTLTWIEDFKKLRSAIYQHNLENVKGNFKFPVQNPNNEIWYLVLSEDELSKTNFSGNKLVPFLEKDIELYFDKVFPRPFIKSILKIKTEELYRKGYFETAEQSTDSTNKYKMYVTYKKKTGLLILNLAYNQTIKDDDGNILDGAESNVIYYFSIQKNGRLLFKEVRLAG